MERKSILSSSSAGIPTLILLDTEGHMITRQGRVEVLNDLECRLFPWHPRPVLELSESNAVQLHEGPCLVLFVGEWLHCVWMKWHLYWAYWMSGSLEHSYRAEGVTAEGSSIYPCIYMLIQKTEKDINVEKWIGHECWEEDKELNLLTFFSEWSLFCLF